MARRAIETSVRYDMRGVEMLARSVHAEILLWEGRWDEASDAAALALDATPYTASVAWRVLGTIQARRGGAGARDALDRMWEIAGPAHALTSTDPAAAALAEYLWLGEEEDASLVGALDDVLAFGLRVGNPWPSGALAFWMWKLGRLDEPPEGSQDFYTWILRGETDRASEFWAARGIPYEQALALMHGTEPDRLVALRLCEELGALPLASKIRADLAAEGVAVPRGRSKRTRDHPAGLTARQAEVLDLLVDGRTNVEIAQRLFLSSRTAENHVAAILLKLDVSTRDEAVARARELGLIGHAGTTPG
jgi:DNA-binding CsgD family transcriptional regulator